MPGNDFDYVLYSDGGSNGGRAAAGACILEDVKAGTRRYLGVFLGEGTNNEAEILSALLGFSSIQLQLEKTHGGASVHWISDSEYVLKSATGYINNWQRNGWKTADKKPVKNQGLWRAYLTLSAGLKISSEHVRGHTGHPENETCDEAVNWLKAEGDAIFDHSPTRQADLTTTLGHTSWTFVDGRDGMSYLRKEAPDEEQHLFLVELLREAPDSSASHTPGADGVRSDPLAPAMKYLDQALKAAKKAAASSPEAKELAESIQEIIAQKKKSAR